MAQASSFECLESTPQWTSVWEEAVHAFDQKLEARTGAWYDTRLGRQWRAIDPRQRRALVLIAMANSRRVSEGRIIDERTELLLVVTQYFAKLEYCVENRRDPCKRSRRRTEESLRVYLQRWRLSQRASTTSLTAWRTSQTSKKFAVCQTEEPNPWSG